MRSAKIKMPVGQYLHLVRAIYMFSKRRKNPAQLPAHTAAQAKLDAISRSQAVIEFTPEGLIVGANENFLTALGYTLDEIKGRHHSIFMDPGEAAEPAYAEFWGDLEKGRFFAGKFRRLAKGNLEVWIQASYNAILDRTGRTTGVVKVATDITADEQRSLQLASERTAAARAQAEVVAALAEGLSKLSEGDLQQRLSEPFQGGYEELRSDFNAALAKLEAALGDVAGKACAISGGAGEISSAADELSGRTEKQAATLEETAAALEQITTTVAKTAVGSAEARKAAQGAQAEATRSDEVVERAIQAMGQIGVRVAMEQKTYITRFDVFGAE